MARRAGFLVKYNDDLGTPPSKMRLLSATSIPVGGDLCTVDATGLPQFQVTTTAVAATQLLSFLCIDGIYDGLDAMNKPGYTAATANTFGVAQWGGRTAQDGGGSGKRSPFIAITKPLWFAMDILDSATTAVVGTSYGLTRSSAGNYVIDLANANPAVKIMGLVDSDVFLGFGLAPVTGTYPQFGAVTNRHSAVWVTALSSLFI